MSKGSYWGGSTTIGPGGWATYDPATQKLQRWTKCDPATGRPWTKAKRSVSLGDVRFGFLGRVVEAELLKKDFPNPPSKFRDMIEAEIKIRGGILLWARSQPRYAELKRRMENKLKQKGIITATGSLAKSK